MTTVSFIFVFILIWFLINIINNDNSLSKYSSTLSIISSGFSNVVTAYSNYNITLYRGDKSGENFLFAIKFGRNIIEIAIISPTRILGAISDICWRYVYPSSFVLGYALINDDRTEVKIVPAAIARTLSKQKTVTQIVATPIIFLMTSSFRYMSLRPVALIAFRLTV